MNAPVLALIGQIPQSAISAAGSAICTKSATRPASSPGWSTYSARIRAPAEAPRLVAAGDARDGTGRPGPAVLECAIDVWGRSGPVAAIAPPSPPSAAADRRGRDRCRGQAARRREAPDDRLRRRRAGRLRRGHARCRAMLQAPVLGYRRGRGVLDSRDPLSVTLPLGHELWGEADVVLAVGTRLLIQFRNGASTRTCRSSASTPIPRSRSASGKPAVGADRRRRADPARGCSTSLPAHNRKRPSRNAEMEERQAQLRKRLAKLAPQIGYPRCDPRRAAGGRHLRRRGDADRLRRAPRHAGLQAAHLSLARLSGQSRLGLRHRARRAGRAARRAGAVDLRRRRLPVHRERTGDRDAPPHSAGQRSCSTTAPSATCAASRRRYGNRLIASDLANPDFVRFAESFGAAAERARTPEELRAALRRGFKRPRRPDPDRGAGRAMPSPWEFIMPAARAGG